MSLHREWPAVKKFTDAATMHAEAAGILWSNCDPLVPSVPGRKSFYLAGYAVECGLKALLLTAVRPNKHRVRIAWLKIAVGHDIHNCWALLAELKRPPALYSEIVRDIRRVAARWNTEMRYDARPRDPANTREIIASLTRIMAWITEA